jgi:hypothetical protein
MSTDWVPASCTLPTVEQPLRLAKFDDLFTTVRSVERGPTSARLLLTADADRVRRLAAAESECCSFFRFTVTPLESVVALDVEVPPQYADVLAALVERASAVLR